MTNFSLRFTSILLSAFFTIAAGASPQEVRQTVSAAGISADVHIGPDLQHGGHRVDVTFHQISNSTNVHVACLSVYRDFTYQLEDATGRTIALNQSAIEHPPFGESYGNQSEFALPAGRATPSCESFDWKTAPNRVALLSVIYPNLPPGEYTLRMAFSPRGSGLIAPLAPMTFRILQRHGL